MWATLNPDGHRRVVVTRDLPGELWKSVLVDAGCRIDVWRSPARPAPDDIAAAIGDRCDAVIGQLTESWDSERLRLLSAAGARVYSNYAVGFDNVDIEAATKHGIAVTNTPGVLTRTTAELAVGLTLAAARRIVEADAVVRAGRFDGWEPDLMLGTQLYGKTLGIVGAGRIGTAYALSMVRGFGMNLIYHGPRRKVRIEELVAADAALERSDGRREPWCRYVPELDDLLAESDVLSLHPPLTSSTFHLLNACRLDAMKRDAILVNVSRGPVIDEEALVAHCRANLSFRAALDVFEDEPALKPGLADLPNVVLAPHIGSASTWTRESMSIIAARNVVGVLEGYPLLDSEDIESMLAPDAPEATPSVLNPAALAGR
ncbi:MAG: D-glycerate dehydrogenase [Rhodothermales bacterium]|nr:D-glycerate dehydrogenase [Rhodothermales bacterium]